MKKISSKEIQTLELDILKKFKNYAKQHNISFFLCGGTLLGAIRHTGCIRWDDDIDICVPRDSYAKLIELAKENRFIDVTNYKFCLSLAENYRYPYIKIINRRNRWSLEI